VQILKEAGEVSVAAIGACDGESKPFQGNNFAASEAEFFTQPVAPAFSDVWEIGF
jgi:hypothetical protein